MVLVSPPDISDPGEPRGFFGPMLTMMDRMVESGFVKPAVLDLLEVVTTAEEAVAYLDALERTGGPAAIDSDALLPTTPPAGVAT